ncbi:MAG: hypothetical protein Tsb0020_34390 [Haliangiales bacterium]
MAQPDPDRRGVSILAIDAQLREILRSAAGGASFDVVTAQLDDVASLPEASRYRSAVLHTRLSLCWIFAGRPVTSEQAERTLREYLDVCADVDARATAVMATVREYPALAALLDEFEPELASAAESDAIVYVRAMWSRLRRDLE